MKLDVCIGIFTWLRGIYAELSQAFEWRLYEEATSMVRILHDGKRVQYVWAQPHMRVHSQKIRMQVLYLVREASIINRLLRTKRARTVHEYNKRNRT